MLERSKKKLCSTECVQNLNFVCLFFPVVRIRALKKKEMKRKEKKELDLQQNSLISGCTCSTICISFHFFPPLDCFIPEEKKSVISNFLIVIVFFLLCCIVFHCGFFYDLFMKFMLFLSSLSCSSAQASKQCKHLLGTQEGIIIIAF